MSKTDDVEEFHYAFGVPIGNSTLDDPARLDLRHDLIEEEFGELSDAMDAKDSVAILDALVDLTYVAIGFAVELGYDFDEAWERVHESNMAKLDRNGDPIFREDGKVLKPEGWSAPSLDDLV
jgi:predicted HAD superfamily Cof-like phosphohydrolase